MQYYKFSTKKHKDFADTLKARVRAYFKENDLSPNGNRGMVFKTIIALATFIVPYIFLLAGGYEQVWLLFLLWITMGFGAAFIGLSVMHDALHGSYSRHKWVNRLIGYSAELLGISGDMWKFQHNSLHHTYTNVDHVDEDIEPRFLFRFSPNQPRKWFHKYQFLYVTPFYGISTLTWVGFKDFTKPFSYRRKGLIPNRKSMWRHFVNMSFTKVVYFSLFLVLPIILLKVPFWLTILMFLSMHFVAGLILSLIFQTAHVMPSSDFILPEDNTIEQNWLVHQLMTTTNYAPKNRILTWFIGGLNFQVEHHLFPNVCHVHYRRISKIVQQTTKEFNLPYHVQKSFRSAILSHFRMLIALGRGDRFQPVVA